MSKNPGLTFFHRFSHLAVHPTKYLKTKIASYISQAQLLSHTASYYYTKVQIYHRKYRVGFCNPMLCLMYFSSKDLIWQSHKPALDLSLW